MLWNDLEGPAIAEWLFGAACCFVGYLIAKRTARGLTLVAGRQWSLGISKTQAPAEKTRP